MNRLPVLLVAVGAFALSACAGIASTTAISANPETIPDGPRVPLRVGVLVSPEQRAFVAHGKIPLGEWLYPYGQHLEGLCAQTFAQVFDSAVPVASRDFAAVDLIVEPTFDQAASQVVMTMSTISSTITVGFSASTATGPVWNKSFYGTTNTADDYNGMPQHGRSLSIAIAGAAKQMREDFSTPAFLSKFGRSAAPGPNAPAQSGGKAWWQR